MKIIKSSTFQSSVASSVCILWNVCGCVADCSCVGNCTQYTCSSLGCLTYQGF
ncbi:MULTISPECIES: hypothetical protein [Clostridium]|uniref:hypothetical protein n=1 Tax=Clostridium TaxID=1485 RepID=UPI000E05BFDC|nr:hypothetical protein [Clostridium sporogenes]MCW6087210.1 hypothetical protein [Clostridium sporogenes]STC72648.1 Uncharacterised protein [Clostridium botulinum]